MPGYAFVSRLLSAVMAASLSSGSVALVLPEVRPDIAIEAFPDVVLVIDRLLERQHRVGIGPDELGVDQQLRSGATRGARRASDHDRCEQTAHEHGLHSPGRSA